MEYKTLSDLLKNGYVEITEFGFNRKSVLYGKKNERLIYNCEKEIIILKYCVKNGNK